jgi:hypothetical protein
MVYDTLITEFLFLLCPSSDILKNTTFRELELLPTQIKGWEAYNLLGLLEKANPNHRTMLKSKTQ